jgi:hypothetical protein
MGCYLRNKVEDKMLVIDASLAPDDMPDVLIAELRRLGVIE